MPRYRDLMSGRRLLLAAVTTIVLVVVGWTFAPRLSAVAPGPAVEVGRPSQRIDAMVEARPSPLRRGTVANRAAANAVAPAALAIAVGLLVTAAHRHRPSAPVPLPVGPAWQRGPPAAI